MYEQHSKGTAQMTAYDLDGTLCTETPARWWEKPLFLLFGDAYGRLRKAWETPILKPEGEYIIITSRTGTAGHFRRTMKWLMKYGYYKTPVYMMHRETGLYKAEFKAEMCAKLFVDTYYENEPAVAQYLRETVPGLEVVEV